MSDNLRIGKNLVYLTVGDFYKLACGFLVRQGNICAQLGQGAPMIAFKEAFLQAEQLLGKKRSGVRYDDFVCGNCSERFATVTLKDRGYGVPRRFCSECAPPKRQATRP